MISRAARETLKCVVKLDFNRALSLKSDRKCAPGCSFQPRPIGRYTRKANRDEMRSMKCIENDTKHRRHERYAGELLFSGYGFPLSVALPRLVSVHEQIHAEY
jgi:hypothetical protein